MALHLRRSLRGASIALVLAAGVELAAAQSKPAATRPAARAAASDSSAFDLQVKLARAHFSPGEIDGRAGSNTNRAIAAFASARNVSPDATAVMSALDTDTAPTVISYTIAAADVAGPFIEEIPTDLIAQSQLPALPYTSPVEALAERFHVSPALLRQMNPGVTFAEGQAIKVPNIEGAPVAGPAAKVVVSKSQSGLTVFDASNQVVFFAPVTSGSEHDPLPIGDWTVKGVSKNPTFNYNPDLFWDADPAHGKAKIPAGPNNPVGVVWIDLSKEHYGIHGTPEPSRIGHTTSHGCVRMTNWDAATVASMVKAATPVAFVE